MIRISPNDLFLHSAGVIVGFAGPILRLVKRSRVLDDPDISKYVIEQFYAEIP
jgi:hypothetical protein